MPEPPLIAQSDDEEIGRQFAAWMKKSGRLATTSLEEAEDDALAFANGFMYGMLYAAGKLAARGDVHAREALLSAAGITPRRKGAAGSVG